MKRPHRCWSDCPIHDWNEVEVDWVKLREPTWVICDGCRAMARCKRGSRPYHELPDSWTREFYPCPEKHYCPKCGKH